MLQCNTGDIGHPDRYLKIGKQGLAPRLHLEGLLKERLKVVSKSERKSVIELLRKYNLYLVKAEEAPRGARPLASLRNLAKETPHAEPVQQQTLTNSKSTILISRCKAELMPAAGIAPSATTTGTADSRLWYSSSSTKGPEGQGNSASASRCHRLKAAFHRNSWNLKIWVPMPTLSERSSWKSTDYSRYTTMLRSVTVLIIIMLLSPNKTFLPLQRKRGKGNPL